jgi:hypothetical protein
MNEKLKKGVIVMTANLAYIMGYLFNSIPLVISYIVISVLFGIMAVILFKQEEYISALGITSVSILLGLTSIPNGFNFWIVSRLIFIFIIIAFLTAFYNIYSVLIRY